MDRLAADRDVRAVLRARCSAGGTTAVVHVRLRNDAAPDRAAVMAGRAVGTAVVRNRAKRRIRSVLRGMAGVGRDVVVVARPGAAFSDYTALSEELAALLARATARASVMLGAA